MLVLERVEQGEYLLGFPATGVHARSRRVWFSRLQVVVGCATLVCRRNLDPGNLHLDLNMPNAPALWCLSLPLDLTLAFFCIAVSPLELSVCSAVSSCAIVW